MTCADSFEILVFVNLTQWPSSENFSPISILLDKGWITLPSGPYHKEALLYLSGGVIFSKELVLFSSPRFQFSNSLI